MKNIIKPNLQQQQAINHDQGPLLIVAGAGTGKTRVLTERIATLILNEKAKVHEILAMTFTEKAALEMETRIDEMLPYGYVDLWVMTFHSFCDKLLRAHALDFGLPNKYKLLDQVQTWLIVKKNLDKFNLDYYKPLGNPTKFIHALINHFSRCKDEGILPSDYLKYAEDLKLDSDSAEFIKQLDLQDYSDKEKKVLMSSEILRVQEIANAFHVYQQILLDNDALDFADLILYTVELFKKRPLILQKYRQQFKYIMVDEFQDTNTIQYELIKLLASPKNNLTVVGDDDQSVYRFRGASISNILQFKDDFKNAKEIVLTKNYRSSQEILDLAYKFIQLNNPYRLETKLKIDKQLVAENNLHAQIQHWHFDNNENEAIGVVNMILELAKNDPTCTWADFAILVRNNESAKIYTLLLQQAKIPYQYMAMRGLYAKAVIIDLINYLKILDDYHESSAMFRVLNFKFWELESEQITKLTFWAKKKQLSLYETLKQAGTIPQITQETLQCLEKILAHVSKHSALAKQSNVSQLYNTVVREIGFLDFLIKQNDQESFENIEYLNQFFEKIKAFEENNDDDRLKNFMELLEMEMQAGDSGKLKISEQDSPDMVKILTVHMSKGLEYKYVFIVNLVDRTFPSDDRKEPIEIPAPLLKIKTPETDSHLQEERRLFYVALTRAKLGVFLTSAIDCGGLRPKKLSRFLIECGFDNSKVIRSEKTLDQPTKKSVVIDNLVIPNSFSVSSLAMYERCPYQFYFANVLKIPTFGKDALTFGNVIHNTLKQFVEQSFNIKNTVQIDLFGNNVKENKVLSLKEFLEIYESNWSDDWYSSKENKEQYYIKGKNIVKSFYQDFLKTNPQVNFIEQSFNYKIKDFVLKGRIDRVDHYEDGMQIIDYKTGKTKGDKLSADEKQQLVFYDIVLRDVFHLEPKLSTYYYLEENVRRDIIVKEKERERLIQKYFKLMSKITEKQFEPKPSQFVCQFCDYKDICDHKKL